LEEAPGVPLNDVVEVSNYVAALEHGLHRLKEGFPLSNRLLREIHCVLLSRGRGSDKTPGEFRRSQNWIGGSRPGNAAFVPPPHNAVPDCMAELERFLHTREDGLPLLLRVGLAHVQFETIHPFLDGNGRVGRLLVTLLLCHAGALREPLLYLSLFLNQHRERYYDLLNYVHRTGDWEEWLAFFLEGVQVTATGAVDAARQIGQMFQENHERIEKTGRRAGSRSPRRSPKSRIAETPGSPSCRGPRAPPRCRGGCAGGYEPWVGSPCAVTFEWDGADPGGCVRSCAYAARVREGRGDGAARDSSRGP